MDRKDWDESIAEDCDGPGEIPARARLMRSFLIPTRFVEPGSDLNDVYRKKVGQTSKNLSETARDGEVDGQPGEPGGDGDNEDDTGEWEDLEQGGGSTNAEEDEEDDDEDEDEERDVENQGGQDSEATATTRRTVNYMFALVGKYRVLAIIDFSRLTQLHVTVLDRDWTKNDLTPTSPVSLRTSILIRT